MRLRVVSILLLSLALGACGGGDGDDGDAASVTSSTAGDGLEEYCSRGSAYQELTASVDTSSVESILREFPKLPQAARDVAEVAPAEVRVAHDRLATAAEELVTRLQERAPKSLEEFEAAQNEIQPDLEEKFGSLDPETAEVQRFLESECGLTSDS